MTKLMIAALGSAALAVGCTGTSGSSGDTGLPPTAESTAATAPAPEQTIHSGGTAAPVPAPERSRARRGDTPTAQPARVQPSAPATQFDSTPRAAAAPKVPEYREVTLPAGTRLTLTLATAVASDTSQVEDVVRATLREGVMAGDYVALPAGTEVVGRVTDAERAGRVKGRARLAFRFTRLLPQGDEYDVRTELVERVAEATKGEDATKVGIGAGAGAAIGALLGGGGGAAKGAAIGAAAGTGAVLATRGEEVRLDPGTPIETRLAGPVTVRVPY